MMTGRIKRGCPFGIIRKREEQVDRMIKEADQHAERAKAKKVDKEKKNH